MFGNGTTVTVVDSVLVLLQSVSVIDTEYVVVAVGEAVGLKIVGLSSDAAGCHV